MNLTNMRKSVKPGTVIKVTDHFFGMNGTVEVIQSRPSRGFSRMVARPSDGQVVESWFDWPKASECSENPDGSLTVRWGEDWGDRAGKVAWTLAIVSAS